MIAHIIFDLMGNDLQSQIMTYLWFGVKMKHLPVWDFIHFVQFSSIQLDPVFSSKCSFKNEMQMSQISFVVTRNSISMPSFLSSHIIFLQKYMLCSSIWGFCFFAKRVHVLVKKNSKTIKSFGLKNNQGHLPLFEDFNVFQPRLSQSSLPQRPSSSLACRDNQGHLPLFWISTKTITIFFASKTIKSVGLQRQSRSSTSFQRLQCLSTKTITIFFASETIKYVGLQRQSRSSAQERGFSDLALL